MVDKLLILTMGLMTFAFCMFVLGWATSITKLLKDIHEAITSKTQDTPDGQDPPAPRQ